MASSSTRGAGISRRTTTAAATCGRSESTGSTASTLLDDASAPPAGGFRSGRARRPVAGAGSVAVARRGAARPGARGGSAATAGHDRRRSPPTATARASRWVSARSTGPRAFLAGLGCAFTIVEPDELRANVRALAERLAASADGRSGLRLDVGDVAADVRGGLAVRVAERLLDRGHVPLRPRRELVVDRAQELERRRQADVGDRRRGRHR